MLRFYRHCLVCALMGLLTVFAGCAPVHRGIEPPAAARPGAVDLSDSARVSSILYRQLEEWRNVPYRAGGLSREGIDCSGFVYLTFLSEFGIEIPRSTRHQAGAGYGIPRSRLRAGDLVFFKTGFNSRHVGIYVENKKFIHASKSSGVMISGLDEDYWARRYWRAVRVAL